jgi:hypothetical protein
VGLSGRAEVGWECRIPARLRALADFQNWPEFEKAIGGKFLLRPVTRDGKEIPKSGTGGGELSLHKVYDNPSFRKVLANAIRWAARG